MTQTSIVVEKRQSGPLVVRITSHIGTSLGVKGNLSRPAIHSPELLADNPLGDLSKRQPHKSSR